LTPDYTQSGDYRKPHLDAATLALVLGTLTPMGNRIKELRDKAKLSADALAEKVGTGRSQIVKLERGERRLTVDWMIRIGKALSVDPKELLPQDNGPQTSKLLNELPATLGAHPVDIGQPDLPVYGSARGGPSGVLIIPVEQRPVDWTYRPPHLRNVKDAFAVFASGDSMDPMYKNGQTLWIHPHLPLQPGEGVLVIKSNDEALVKELVRQTERAYVLREYRPKEREFEIPAKDVRAAYRVIGALSMR